MAAHKKGRGVATHYRPNAINFVAKHTTIPDVDSEIVVDLHKLLAKALHGTSELRVARAALYAGLVAERVRLAREVQQ